MKTIRQYDIPRYGEVFSLDIPRFGEIVHCDQFQRMFVLVNPNQPLENRLFKVVRPGDELPEGAVVVGNIPNTVSHPVYFLVELK